MKLFLILLGMILIICPSSIIISGVLYYPVDNLVLTIIAYGVLSIIAILGMMAIVMGIKEKEI